MKSFNKTFKLLEHLVTLHGELSFKFSATSYGNDFDWITDIEENDSLIKLKEILFEFDEEYHDKYELERGSSRTYSLQLNKEDLVCTINYEWDYSYLGSKSTDEDLAELIKDEINTRLSNKMGVSIIEFTENYYYNIVFSTEDALDKGVFLLSEWENDNNVEIPLSTWASLKAAIIALSEENGANTYEDECQFDYNLTHDDYNIIERWSNGIELEELIDDNESYQENNS